MSLSFVGPNGSVEERWIVYALLRDNVQHHLEGGQPSEAFVGLHRLSEALGGGTVDVPARELHNELTRAKEVLHGRPIADLAISLRTRSILSFQWPPPDERQTGLVRDWGGSVPLLGVDAKTLDDVFGSLLESLIRITANAKDDDVLQVSEL